MRFAFRRCIFNSVILQWCLQNTGRRTVGGFGFVAHGGAVTAARLVRLDHKACEGH